MYPGQSLVVDLIHFLAVITTDACSPQSQPSDFSTVWMGLIFSEEVTFIFVLQNISLFFLSLFNNLPISSESVHTIINILIIVAK